jgi:hypothetical protein
MRKTLAFDRRREIAYQFEIQAKRLQFSIRDHTRNFCYQLYDERHMRILSCVVLVESFDFYELRLNRGKHRIDMVICEHHNCCLPVRCVSMEESHEYAVHSLPRRRRDDRQRRNSDEKKLFVSQLLLGVKRANAELETMPDRTRRRYVAYKNSLLRPRRGRPWAS